MRALAPLLLLLLGPALAMADAIYRSTDEDGNPLFTDEPPSDDAEPVRLDPLTTVPADERIEALEPQQEEDAAGAQAGARGYQDVEITYPPADQTVRHNGGLVPFRVELEPEGRELKEGHSVEIVLDGEVKGSGSSLQVSVSPVDRGPHTVHARILDESGAPVAASEPVQFHLLRASVGD